MTMLAMSGSTARRVVRKLPGTIKLSPNRHWVPVLSVQEALGDEIVIALAPHIETRDESPQTQLRERALALATKDPTTPTKE